MKGLRAVIVDLSDLQTEGAGEARDHVEKKRQGEQNSLKARKRKVRQVVIKEPSKRGAVRRVALCPQGTQKRRTFEIEERRKTLGWEKGGQIQLHEGGTNQEGTIFLWKKRPWLGRTGGSSETITGRGGKTGGDRRKI